MRILLVPDCAEGTLNSAAACFRELSAQGKQAAIVWYLWQLAQTNGYTSDIDTLFSNAACFAAEPPMMLDAMDVVNAYNAALAAGAAVTGTLAEAVEGIKCLKNASPQMIRALKTLLLCQLNGAVS